jgi:Asp-tRNA(Asn)/Glu-tRNA(Gln) amidotransferase C subunit
MADHDLTVVKMLFDLAHLTMSDDELERFAQNYATLRAQADALYREDLRPEAPALAFDPLREYA